MTISVFGGAFDPPHLGHEAVVDNLLSAGLAEEVWYLPVKNHHFGKQMLPVEHRLEMLKLITSQPSNDRNYEEHQLTVNNKQQISNIQYPISKIRIEEYELHQEGINYSYDTLVALSEQYPEHTFSFVIGSDNLKNFYKWLENRPKLLDFPFFVYPREGYEFQPLYENMTPLIDMPEVTISSTQIRENRRMGKSLNGLVRPEVEEYIVQNKLYLA